VRWMVICAMVIMATGCATSVRMMGDKRPPINADEVRVVNGRGSGYTAIAMLETKLIYYFSEDVARDVVVQRLKTKAARLGANAIEVHDSYSETEDRWISTPPAGPYGVPMMIMTSKQKLTVSAMAYYVESLPAEE